MLILLIDDDPSVCAVLATVLRRQGHETLGVGSAEQALEALESSSFDAIVADLELPGLGGDDLLRAACIRHPKTRRVMITGKLEVDGEAMERMGVCHRFLSKPCRPAELVAAVEGARAAHVSSVYSSHAPALAV